jgi:YesN/AraC family two-component response regulator
VVKDTGEGIPAEHLERIFDRFYQAEVPEGRDKDGFGIGLSFVKELTEIHHGNISVKSSLAEGTEFTLLLPREYSGEIYAQTPLPMQEEMAPMAAAKSSESEQHQPSLVNQGSSMITILVVEDNRDTMQFITGNLSFQYTVLQAVDGVSGYAIATETIPDLIITDVMMPRMNGIEMTRKIRIDRHTSHIPIIMLTAKSSLESKIAGLEARADDYISKPFSMKELQTRIVNLISIRAELRRKYRDELNISPAEVTTNTIDEAFLTKAIQFVEQNMRREDFSIEQLYQELAMSRSLLHKKLKALTNQSASEFINDIRLRNAARLLKQKSGSISEIAYRVGYNSISYFNVSFKKKFGVTPTEYMG